MRNGRCHDKGSPKLNVTNHSGHRNGIHNNRQHSHHQNDGSSDGSISSEDISGEYEGHCCSAEARNPAIKRGRQIQLLQVC